MILPQKLSGILILPSCRPGVAAAVVLIVAMVWPAWTESATCQVLRPPEVSREYHRAARAWRSGTSLSEAKARLDRVLAILPADAEATLMRARVHLEMNRPAEALQDARRTVALDSDNGDAWLVRAEAAVRAGQPGEADASLDRAAELITTGADRHIGLSWTAQRLGQLDRAEAFARVALALEPELTPAYVRLAEIFLVQGRDDDAVALLSRGLDSEIFTLRDLRRVASLESLVGETELRLPPIG